MTDIEFIRSIAGALESGLVEFFAPWCNVVVVITSDPDDERQGSNPAYISVNYSSDETFTVNRGQICEIVLCDDHVSIEDERHDYCHPEFPNSILHALGRMLNRDERLEQVKKDAIDVADEDPQEGVTYFIQACQEDPLLSRFITENFSVILTFMMSSQIQSKKAVTEWLESWKLSSITELCEDQNE